LPRHTLGDHVRGHAPGRHIHRHANEEDLRVRNHPDDEHRFFREVAQTLEVNRQILVVGPSKTKLHFLRFVEKHDPALAQRIVGLESMDHPTDAQLIAYLRHYFGEAGATRKKRQVLRLAHRLARILRGRSKVAHLGRSAAQRCRAAF
jgi:hypothetical protein